jgi:hypothetical protein
LKGFSIIVYGFRNFKEAIILNQIARESENIPFYCLNSSGLQGFFYADVGLNIKYTSDKNNEKVEKEYTSTDSKTIEEYL